ncbi:glycosyltransferase [Azospirillum sp. RWY-5-1]|uniref:Glycosyltransferase n=2 Tax=Azospirillum oleiclasticum TaxID=2735135 RepID=A0ABX2TAY5_9PROT|nr:glycosyltransferase [Azospirillum oleiclasticum]NYZ15161.1 glycosyltransferase [Azospirillum oleiclasticum]NYZ21418.1 glycosyltransferase [Azospirillum oleiclasticum]
MRIAVIIPVFNDWDSFIILVRELDRVFAGINAAVEVFPIDDGSTEPIPFPAKPIDDLCNVDRVELLSLVCNLGHQRAIATALTEAYRRQVFDIVCVMDGDGEDRPKDLVSLIREHLSYPDHVIVARRCERSEGPAFQAFYTVYKMAFAVLTGRRIDFGNFCVIPAKALERVVHFPDVWNHLAAALVKSRLPIRKVELPRGNRYAGRSKMSLIALVTHGLSAVSTFSDAVFVRLLLMSLGMAGMVAVGLLGVMAVRLFTELAVPGWASTVSGLLFILLVQAVMFSVVAAFLTLAGRSAPGMVPASDALRFIRERTVLAGS